MADGTRSSRLLIRPDIVGGRVSRRMFKGGTALELINATWMERANDVITIVAGVLAILVVRRIQRFQKSWPPETADVFA